MIIRVLFLIPNLLHANDQTGEKKMVQLMDLQERSLNGPVMKAEDFDLAFSMKLRELVAKYDIKYIPEEFIIDDNMADAVFHAGVELLADIGLYHLDTQRVVKFTKEEILEMAQERKENPGKAEFGSGNEKMTIEHRSGEDTRPPTLYSGIAGAVEEDVFISMVQSFAQEEEIEGLSICPGLEKLGSIQPKAGTLSEIHVALWEQEQLKEVLRRVGRPGLNLGLLCTASTPAAIMECVGAGFRDARNTQIGVHIHPDQKIDWERLILAHYCKDRGIVPWQSAATLLGGLCRDAADASVAMIASVLGHMSFANGPMCNIFPTTIEGTWSNRETIWAICASARASERNIRIAFGGTPVSSYIWGRRDLGFYLSAVQTVAFTACGMSYAWLAGGCGAEAVMMGRAMKEAAGTKREKANAIAQTIMNKAEEEISKRGEPAEFLEFAETCDLKTAKPKQEFLDMMNRTMDELVNLGMPYA
jgi:methylamine--corrinoid protein Co-methyltransferase